MNYFSLFEFQDFRQLDIFNAEKILKKTEEFFEIIPYFLDIYPRSTMTVRTLVKDPHADFLLYFLRNQWNFRNFSPI